jgi:hypothetical protein
MPDANAYNISEFNFPGSLGTRLYGISDRGEIIGDFLASEYTDQGFTAGYQGQFVEFGGSFTSQRITTQIYSGSHPVGYDVLNIPSGLSYAYALNNAGEVLYSPSNRSTIYFIDTRSSLLGETTYHTMFPSAQYGYGINDAGLIVGTPGIADSRSGGEFTPIVFPGSTTTIARDINNLGQIGGYYTDATGTHGFLSNGSAFMSIDVPGAQTTRVLGLNDVGQIVGTYTDSLGHAHGFLEMDGSFATIDVAGADETFAFGINDAGQIVGYSSGAGGTHGFTANPQGSAGSDTLIVRISEDAWAYHPDAQFVVKVDGQQVGGVLSTDALHSAGEMDAVTLTGNFTDAKHVTVEFLNDQYGGPSNDVNLYVESVTLNGLTVTGSFASFDANVGTRIGSAVQLYNNGAATFDFSQSSLVLRVSEDQWAGHPDAQFIVMVDGQQIGGQQIVTALHASGQTQEITLSGRFVDAHQISIEFVNDQYGGSDADVNLYVEGLNLNGRVYGGSEAVLDPFSGTYDGASALLFRNGSAVFNIDLEDRGALVV